MLRLFAILWIALLPKVAEANTPFSQVVGNTFGPGGVGAAIFQLVLIAVFGWLCTYIAGAAGQGRIAGMIKIVTTFTCISIVAGVVWNAIKAVGAFGGITF